MAPSTSRPLRPDLVCSGSGGAARFQLSGQLSPPRAGVQRRVPQPDLGQGAGLPGDLHRPGRRSTSPNGWNKPLWTTDCSVLSLLFGKRQLGFSLVSKRRKTLISLTCKAQHHGPGRPCERTHTGGTQRADRGSRSLPTDNHLLQALLTSVRQLLAESTFERPRGPSCFTGSASISRRTFTAPSAGIRSPIASTSRPATCRTCFESRGTSVWPITSAGCASIGPSSCSRNTAFASKRWPAAVVTAM